MGEQLVSGNAIGWGWLGETLPTSPTKALEGPPFPGSYGKEPGNLCPAQIQEKDPISR